MNSFSIELDWIALTIMVWAVAWCVAQFSSKRAYRQAYKDYLDKCYMGDFKPQPPSFPNPQSKETGR